MRFQPYHSHCLTAIGLKKGRVHKLGLCGHFRHLKVTLKLKFHRQRLHVEVTSTTVGDFSDLPFLSYRAKYVKNDEKMSKNGPQRQF